MAGRPSRVITNPPNRIREIRDKKGMTLREVAELTGLSIQALHRLETGETRLKRDQMPAISSAMGVGETDLMYPDETPKVAVIGYVGAGAVVLPIEHLPRWEGEYEVPCPANLDPNDTEALIIEGDSMLPMEPRSVIFVSKSRPLSATEMVGKLCVVELDDDRRLIKIVRPGYKPGHFNLLSTNASPIEDVVIEKAAKVRSILPPDEAGAAGSIPVEVD